MSELAIRRVVVACDAVCELRPAIETATRLAAHLHASLHGVFLEDPGLRLAAGLPFVQQVTLSPGGSKASSRQRSRSNSAALLGERSGRWRRLRPVSASTGRFPSSRGPPPRPTSAGWRPIS
jgi:hypothetical protein